MKTAIRIFVSSTFKDLDIEREMLIKGVFPKVKAYALDKGISLYFVDLRWGITSYNSLEIIKSCLDEIDNCAPYFIGILGNRYGYVPSDINGLELDNIEQYKNKSITEMEITYGVFNRIEKNHSIFAIKEAVSYDEMIRLNIDDSDALEVENSIKKLESLKEKTKLYCQENNIPYFNNYSDINDLCDFFYDELIKIVDRIADEIGDITEFKQTNYINNNLEKVFKNNYMFEYITRALNTNYNKLVIYGNYFEGKTTLLNHYFSLKDNKIIINLAADETLCDINNLYKYLASKFSLKSNEISDVNNYLKEYRGEKLYIVINDTNLINEIDNGNLLRSFPNDISDDVVIIASTNSYTQASSLILYDYYLINHKEFDTFIFAEEYLEFICKKFGKDIPGEVKEFLRTTPLCRYPASARIILDHFIHQKDLSQYSYLKSCNNLKDFYSILIEFTRTRNTYLSYVILLILRIYEIPIDLDTLYEITDSIDGKEKLYITLNKFTFNKAVNEIFSLITYHNGKISLANGYVKTAIDRNVEKNSNAIFKYLSDVVVFYQKNRFVDLVLHNRQLTKTEEKECYYHFFNYYYHKFDEKTGNFYDITKVILNVNVIKFLAKNNCYYWEDCLKLLYKLSNDLKFKEGSVIPDKLILNMARNEELSTNELKFLYKSLVSISQYFEAEEFAEYYNLIEPNNNEFNDIFKNLNILMCGSNFEYAIELINTINFNKYSVLQNKLIIQKILLLFFYLEDREKVEYYLNKYKEVIDKEDSVLMLFEGYLNANLNKKTSYIHMATKLSDIENNTEIEFISNMVMYKCELVNKDIDINQFYSKATDILYRNQAQLLNHSHLAYKFYQYICTYCSIYLYELNNKEEFIKILISIKNKNFQTIVKMMEIVASSKLKGQLNCLYEEVSKNYSDFIYFNLIMKMLNDISN